MTDNIVTNFDILIELHIQSMIFCNKALRTKMNFNKTKGVEYFKEQIAFDKMQIKELSSIKKRFV